MFAYIFAWIAGIPIGLLLKVFWLRLNFAVFLLLAFLCFGGIFFIFGFFKEILPPKAKDVVKVLICSVIVGFLVSCFV